MAAMESSLLSTFANIFLPSNSLALMNIKLNCTVLELYISNCASQAVCPRCQGIAYRLHSHYQRLLTDLPFCQLQIRIYWQTRRFFCDDGTCKRITFTEQIPELASHHARKTQRLSEIIRRIGLEAGGEAGQRLADIFGMVVSGTQILRVINTFGEPTISKLKVVGIDDWAWRKRKAYGTILVDLEKRQVIDLLPDRTPETVAAWFKKHPEIEIVSRDRGKEYIEGISRGLPGVVQVADRFHLLQNVLDALQRMLEPEQEALKLSRLQVRETSQKLLPALPAIPVVHKEGPKITKITSAQLRFNEVKALQLTGISQHEISRQLGLNRRTVSKYFRLSSPPNSKDKIISTSKTVPYQLHLSKRINEGCKNLTLLYQEIREMGFSGSYGSLLRAAHRLGVENLNPISHTVLLPLPHFSSKQAAWALFQPESLLKEPYLSLRIALCNFSAKASKAQDLVQNFRKIVKDRQADKLEAWLDQAAQSAIPEFVRLAASFRGDYAAIKMALHSEWSNGQVEGQNNRLKLIKRQMYGRAGFQLLRRRVLGPAAFS
jgi:transposase